MNNSQPIGFPPGIYYDMDAEVYHADSALSSTGLKKVLLSPLEYYDSAPINPNRERSNKDSFKNGRAFHTMLLEPDKFRSEFTIKPDCKKSTLPGTIGAGDYNDMVNAAQIIKNDQLLSGLIKGGKTEVSIFYRDEETGIMCRVRFDYLHSWGLDYKTTTRSMDKRSLGYEIADYGYDISAAMYLDALRHVTSELPGAADFGFVLLFQQKSRPYIARALHLDEEIIAKGYKKYREGLSIYKENIEKYGISPWASPYQMVDSMFMEDMPRHYIHRD